MVRVLVVGDSPALQTGFGKVNRIAVETLISAGHEVGYLAGQESKSQNLPQLAGTKARYFPREKDYMGLLSIQDAAEDLGAEVVYTTSDPGTYTAFAKFVPARIPFLGYVPIEGEPIVEHQWREVLSELNWFTCSQYGVDVTKQSLNKVVKYAYHGIDSDFKPDLEARERTRKMLGWENKFVIICVAQNVHRKQWPRLIEAVSILKHKYKQKDIVLYAHTVPFDNYWLDGWNLPIVSNAFGVYDEVVFSPQLDSHNAAIPLSTSGDIPSLVDLYNASDVFAMPSQVEGFGLPIAEAMACGVPVVVTRYGAGWEVASPAGIGVRPHDWELHKSGTKYGNVDPFDLAKAILALKRNPKERARRAKLGLERVKDFTWDQFRELLLDGVIREAQAKTRQKNLQERSGSTDGTEGS